MNNEIERISGKILIYQNEKGDTKIDVYFAEETIWLTQRKLAELYQTSPQNITLHIKNIYDDGELEREATCKEFLQVQNENGREVKRTLLFFNLPLILAVGYRVRGNVGVHFRRWASGILTEYLKKGFVMNDERLRNPKEFGKDYFDELLARIRDIRASEKRFYQKVRDIFALSADYNSQSEIARTFFKSIQNKLEYAVTGLTAPEIIMARADASKDNMGLTNYAGGKVRKGDIKVAKNYMTEDEIRKLNRLVTMFLDYAEDQAEGGRVMYMADWEQKVSEFLRFNGREELTNFGSVKRVTAENYAVAEFEKYDANRRAREAEAADLEDLTLKIKRLER